MKKLLLASMIMIGVSGFAYAQTPDAVKAKKAAAKSGKGQPTMTTAATEMGPSLKVAPAKEKTDAEVAKEAKVAEVKEVKAVHPHPNKVKKQD